MKYDEFMGAVKKRIGAEDRVEAERTALAVLQALSDRLTGDEAEDLLSQLPARLKESIIVTEPATRLTPNEFVELIANALEITPEEARRRVAGVFSVLREAVTPGELHDVLVQLPSGYFELLEEYEGVSGRSR
jgi:uncharacterized protein (DUF2267 family)